MSFVSQALDEVRTSLLNASSDGADGGQPLARGSYGTASAREGACDATASDPHSPHSPARIVASDQSNRGRVASFFRGANGDDKLERDRGIAASAATRRRRGGSVSCTDAAFPSLLERTLRRASDPVRSGTPDAINSTATHQERSMEYTIELLAARAGALASKRRQRGQSGSYPNFGAHKPASLVPYSPDSVVAELLDVPTSTSNHGNATDGDGHDFFGLQEASSALQSFSTPTRSSTTTCSVHSTVATSKPPSGCWDDRKVNDGAGGAVQRDVCDTEEYMRSLCWQLLGTKGDQAIDDQELGEDEQRKLRKDVIRLLVLLSESPASTEAISVEADEETEARLRLHLPPQSDPIGPASAFYNNADVIVPMESRCRPMLEESDTVLWSVLALVGVPSPPYSLIGDKLTLQPFNIHGESDSTSLFGVARSFANAGSRYLFLTGLKTTRSSCEAWRSAIHRIEHWLDRYRALVEVIKHEVEESSLGDQLSTRGTSLLELSARTRGLTNELTSLASIVRRLSRSSLDGDDCDMLDAVYQLIELEQLSVTPGDDEAPYTLLLLQDLFAAMSNGIFTRIYRAICFGSQNETTRLGKNEQRLPSFLRDLSNRIGETTKSIDLIRESDHSTFCRLASFHNGVGAGDESLSLLCFGSTDEDLKGITKAEDDHINRYRSFVQSYALCDIGSSGLSRSVGDSSDHEKIQTVTEDSSDIDKHVCTSVATFGDLPVAPSWKYPASTETIRSMWIDGPSESEDENDCNLLSSPKEKSPVADFFSVASDLSPPELLGDGRNLSLLGTMSLPGESNDLLPVDISIEQGIRRFITKHCKVTEHFSLLFFLRRSQGLLEHLVLVRRIFLGYGCYLTRLVSRCFLARVDHPNKVITSADLEQFNSFCFIASAKEMELLEIVDVHLSLLADDIMSASDGLPIASSQAPAMQLTCPMSSVIDGSATTKYRVLRAFILRHLWVEEKRKLTWRRLIQMDRTRTESETLRHLYVIRNEIGHWCSALSQYINLTLQASWRKFMIDLPLDLAEGLGSIQEVYCLHQANLNHLLAAFFLVDDDSALARVKREFDSLYKIISSIFEALVSSEGGASGSEDAPSLSSLWVDYGNGRKALLRSLRIASSSHSFCRDLMEQLVGDNAESHVKSVRRQSNVVLKKL